MPPSRPASAPSSCANFIRALPRELIESARIEGVSEFRIFWHLVLPLVRPAIAALAVLIFTFIWNDFFWATVLTNSEESKPITAGIRALNGQFVSRWHLVSAASLLAAVPPVLMFFAMQKHFIAGLTPGRDQGGKPLRRRAAPETRMRPESKPRARTPVSALRIDGAPSRPGRLGTTIVFGWTGREVPAILHIGTRLPDTLDLEHFAASRTRPLPFGTLDVVAPIAVSPEPGTGFMGHPGLIANRDVGGWGGRMALVEHDAQAHGVHFHLADRERGIALTVTIEIDPETDVDSDAHHAHQRRRHCAAGRLARLRRHRGAGHPHPAPAFSGPLVR